MPSDDSVALLGRSYGPYDFDPHIRQLILDVLASDEALAIIAAAQRRSLARVDAAGAAADRLALIEQELAACAEAPLPHTVHFQVSDGQLVAVWSNGTRQVIAAPTELLRDQTSQHSDTADR